MKNNKNIKIKGNFKFKKDLTMDIFRVILLKLLVPAFDTSDLDSRAIFSL